MKNVSELWSIMEGMSARSPRALEVHEGGFGGVSQHWRSMEEFGAGLAYISRRGEARDENLSRSELDLARFKECMTVSGFGRLNLWYFAGGKSLGRLWEAQSIVFYTLRAGPPTQLSLGRASF